MKLTVKNNNTFSLRSESGRPLLSSMYYTTKGNASRAARKAKFAMLASTKSLQIGESGQRIQVVSSQGHILLSSDWYSTAGNCKRAYENMQEQLRAEREASTPLQIED